MKKNEIKKKHGNAGIEVDLRGSGAKAHPPKKYPKIMLKNLNSTLPICKRDNVTHSRGWVRRKFRFPVFSKAPFDYNFLVI